MTISLSKGRVMAGWQCAKQLWLRVHRSDLQSGTGTLIQFVHGRNVQSGF